MKTRQKPSIGASLVSICILALLAIAACSAASPIPSPPPPAKALTPTLAPDTEVRTITSRTGKFVLEVHMVMEPGFNWFRVRDVNTHKTIGEYHPEGVYESLGLWQNAAFILDDGYIAFTYGVFITALHIWDFQHDRLSTIDLLPLSQVTPVTSSPMFDLHSLIFSSDGQWGAASFCDTAENHGRGCHYVTLIDLHTQKPILLRPYLPLQHALSFTQKDTVLVLEGCSYFADGIEGACVPDSDGNKWTAVEVSVAQPGAN